MGKGTRCSIKNCFNRRSKYHLSLFTYPSDYVLRKTRIEKYGLEVAFAEEVKMSERVCCIHFDDCFKNLEKKNRLIPGAVPSLFLGSGKKTMNDFLFYFVFIF